MWGWTDTFTNRLAVTLLCAAALVACGGGGGGGGGTGTPPPVATPPPQPDPEPEPEPRFSTATLEGAYVFRSIGFSEEGLFLTLGHFTADGDGRISGRQENVGLLGPIPFEGTYTLNEDGTGSANLSYTFDGTAFESSIALTVASRDGGAFVDREDDQIFLGEFVRQQGPINTARFSGNHVYALIGSGVRSIGRIAFDGAGNVTGGDEDRNEGGFVTLDAVITGGNYQTDPQTGRTALRVNTAFGISDFIVYPVSAEHAFVMATDPTVFVRGDLWTQTTSARDTSAVSGPYVFVTTGAASGGNLTALGRLRADGNGNIGDGRIHLNEPAGVLDDEPLSGSLVLDAQGVGDAILEFAGTPSNYGLRLVAADRLVYLQTDAGTFSSGLAVRQQDRDFSNADFEGEYVFNSDRLTANALTLATGVLTADGGGVLELSGTGTRFQEFAGFSQPTLTASGTYATRSDGRGTASIPGLSDQFRYYRVDDEVIVMIALDLGESQSLGVLGRE